MIIFYEKPGCATNARQKARLTQNGHELTVRDLLTESWTADRLRSFFGALPVRDWFNPAAPRVKSGEIDPAGCSAETALAQMLADPLLIRRPLLETARGRMAGFDPDRVAQLLGAPLREQDDLQGCSHPETPCPAPNA